MWNFEPSRRIYTFSQNSLQARDKGTNTAYFGRETDCVCQLQ